MVDLIILLATPKKNLLATFFSVSITQLVWMLRVSVPHSNFTLIHLKVKFLTTIICKQKIDKINKDILNLYFFLENLHNVKNKKIKNKK